MRHKVSYSWKNVFDRWVRCPLAKDLIRFKHCQKCEFHNRKVPGENAVYCYSDGTENGD